MNSEILFLAPYPTNENIKDGMISRVKAIDSHFKDINRTYLNISLFHHWRKERYNDDNVIVYNLNFLVHFISVLSILKVHNHIYFHSLYMVRFVWMLLNRNKNLTIDVHGVVPEEEKNFNKSHLKSRYFSYVEKKIFKKVTTVICVTGAMRDYYKKKYPFFKGNYIIYSIMPESLYYPNDNELHSIKSNYKDKIHILYSGGIQAWQNIDLMLDVIKNNQSSKIHYSILTGNKEEFEKMIQKLNINTDNISIESRNPSELWKDYVSADYAFILREDDVVNRVANPTKLVEYLYYGLIPIVITPHIGDYNELGYDYLTLSDFNINIDKPLTISYKNSNIVKRLIIDNKMVNIKEVVVN